MHIIWFIAASALWVFAISFFLVVMWAILGGSCLYITERRRYHIDLKDLDELIDSITEITTIKNNIEESISPFHIPYDRRKNYIIPRRDVIEYSLCIARESKLFSEILYLHNKCNRFHEKLFITCSTRTYRLQLKEINKKIEQLRYSIHTLDENLIIKQVLLAEDEIMKMP